MTVRDWIKILLVFLAFMGLVLSIWMFGNAHAHRTDNGGPLTWIYLASALPCGGLAYLLTRRFNKRRPRLVPGLVAAIYLLSVTIAAGIALVSGVIVALNSTNFPWMAASLGWHLGRWRDL